MSHKYPITVSLRGRLVEDIKAYGFRSLIKFNVSDSYNKIIIVLVFLNNFYEIDMELLLI